MEECEKFCLSCKFATTVYSDDTLDCSYFRQCMPCTFYCKAYKKRIEDPVAYIKENISERARLELLAEEAAELSKAALKMIRVLDSTDDVYPVDPNKYDYDTCMKNLIEEVTDVGACCNFLNICADRELAEKKTLGMVQRIENHK